MFSKAVFKHKRKAVAFYATDIYVELLKIAIKEFEQANYRSEAEIE